MTIFVMKNKVMFTLGSQLHSYRKDKSLKMREVASALNIDQALISKFESGKRIPTERQIVDFAGLYGVDKQNLRKQWLSEKVYEIVKNDGNAIEILNVAESRIEYLKNQVQATQLKLSKSILVRLKKLDGLKKQYSEKRPLNELQLKKMLGYFITSYTYESNKIEGNTLTLQETELVVNQGLTISGKSMTEHLEAINHNDAARYIVDLIQSDDPFNKRVLLELHSLILRGIDRKYGGRWRDVPVKISGSTHEPPQPFLLDKLMEDYFIQYSTDVDRLHPVILAAEMHERLVSIHPFIDGNGRTARLVMNLILLQNGFTIANIKGDNKSKLRYYRSLEEVQANNVPEVFYELIMDVVEESLIAHLELAG